MNTLVVVLLLFVIAALGLWVWRLRKATRATPVPTCSSTSRSQQVAAADLVNILTALTRLYTIAIYGNQSDDAIVNALVVASADARAGDRLGVWQTLNTTDCQQQLVTTATYINSQTDADLVAIMSSALADYKAIMGNFGATLSSS